MRMGEITNGANTPKQQAAYLKKRAHYLGFREGPDGTRERYYILGDKGFIATEYGNDHEIIITNVRACSKTEAELIMGCKDLQFGD